MARCQISAVDVDEPAAGRASARGPWARGAALALCLGSAASAAAAETPGTVERSLPFLVTSVTLQQQEFEGLLSEYVRWGGETTHAQVVDAFDRFRTGSAALAARADRTERLLAEYRDLAGPSERDEAASATFERTGRLLRRWDARAGAVLDRIAPDIGGLEEGDAIVHHGIRRQLDSLGNDLLALQLTAFARQDLVDVALERRERRLAHQVRLASVALGIGVLLVLSMLGFFLHLKARAASALVGSNEQLKAKVEEARRLAEQLEFNATHDQLTGLHNRHGFVAMLEATFADADVPHGIVFIDLDKFKAVNDTCGHGAGDDLLGRIGELLAEQARGRGIAARFGGDEFVLLLPRCNPGTLRGVANSACRLLALLDFRYEGMRFPVGGSIGAVLFESSSASADALMQAVDEASYESKREGGGRVTFRDLRDAGSEDGSASNVMPFRRAG